MEGLLSTQGGEPDSVMHEHRAQYGHVEDLATERITAEEMDEKRKQNMAYEYLCRLEEAKKWMEACISEEMPATTELEENLQNGVYLAKLAHYFAPEAVPLRRIYDRDLERYKKSGLHYRHTDNVVQFFGALAKIGLPKIFYPDTADVYDRKNMPKLIYCVHALSLYLFKKGLAPQMQDLIGKIDFTEEQINVMKEELEKYGIQMPSFSKIGGILANEMPIDEAALHAAIIAINEAIEKHDAEETVRSLQNPAAHLANVSAKNASAYQEALFNAKDEKAQNMRNTKMTMADQSQEADIYDEILTQSQVQSQINQMNVIILLEDLDEAVCRRDAPTVLDILCSPTLSLSDVLKENKDYYVAQLYKAREGKTNNFGDDAVLDKDEVQQQLLLANLNADGEHQKRLSVGAINQSLQNNDPDEFIRSLQNPKAGYPTVHEFAARLYFDEFRSIKDEKGADLDYEEICGGITVLTAVANINRAIDTGSTEAVIEAMDVPQAHVSALYHENGQRYLKELSKRKSKKAICACPLLTHGELQEAVDSVNQQVTEEHERIEAVQFINQVLESGDADAVLGALKQPATKLSSIDANQAVHYHCMLLEEKQVKAALTKDPHVALWWEDIQKSILKANMNAEEGNRLGTSVAIVNQAIQSDDEAALVSSLGSADLGTAGIVVPACGGSYLAALKSRRDSNASAEGAATGSGWLMNSLRQRDISGGDAVDGPVGERRLHYDSYFNVHTMQHAWRLPAGEQLDASLLNQSDVQGAVRHVTEVHHRELYVKTNEGSIVKIQAHVRGHLAKRKFKERLNYLNSQEDATQKIQAWYKGKKQRKQYKERLDYLRSQEEAIVKLQSLCKMRKAKKVYSDRLAYLKAQEAKVVKIQAAWRSNQARHDYTALMFGKNPQLGIVRKFIHLLDQSDVDFAEEIEIQNVRQKVVGLIRSNRQLEIDLDAMDVKIGLLVRNRISIEEVVYQEKKLKKHKEGETGSQDGAHVKGIMGMSKESHDRLDAYQHLFYQLQTNPIYLAKLLFEMPQSRSNTFMESVILTLYNYASNPREEYLLLKLFATSLEEEIRTRLDKIGDIVVGNPLAVKMVISFHRSSRGQSSLRDILSPLIKALLEDKNVKINTNPIEVYKNWVNQTESETGEKSSLPYDVVYEEAMSHDEVKKRLDQSVQQLQYWSDKFLSHILQSLEKIPYGMRFISKVMFDALRAKFPDAPDKEILKVVGNLLYYRYINSAIVAPDAFDVIDISAAEKGLSNDQRRNLGSIAKILQFAAANKGFGGDSQHLACLNPYIKASHEKFKSYFKDACDIRVPEEHFNIDPFSDAMMVTRPMIQINVGELLDTHQLLLAYEDKIAPDHADSLHAVLDSLGSKVPSAAEFLGAPASASTTGSNASEQLSVLAKTEISLTLAPKFDLSDDDKAELQHMLIRTKLMTMDVVRSQPGDTLTLVLATSATPEQEREHTTMIARKELVDKRAAASDNAGSVVARNKVLIDDQRLSLEEKKKLIRTNIEALVEARLLPSVDPHQQLVNLIAQDIRYQRRYRQSRKQDLVKLRAALDSLASKRSFYESQIDYYNQYVRACLDNLNSQRRKSGSRLSVVSVSGAGDDTKEKKKASSNKQRSIKYSGAKLHEKGIIVEIEGLPGNQFKNVQFEITTTAKSGVFDVHAKFMGIATEKYELKFQDLLHLQYEGVAVMEMFDRAKVNVNLLIYLLNAKFYGRQ